VREIKFRAWDHKYKYMNYKVCVAMWGEWTDVAGDENYTACSVWIKPEDVDYDCQPHWAHFEPYSKCVDIMQYTGLKDHAKRDIYEGDILLWQGKDQQSGEYLSDKYEVVFKDGAFMARNYRGYHPKFEPLAETLRIRYESDIVTIIGNIHQDAELLEVE